MAEEEIDLEVLASHFKRHLASDERKSNTQLDEELAQVREESPFEIPLVCFLGE